MTDALRAVDSYRLNPRGRRNVTPQRAPRAVVSVAWHQHQDLLRNVGSLVATTGVTSGLGAVYWTISARLFSQQDVGYGAAEVSIMTLLGTIGMLGLGTLLIAELPRRNQRAGLISVALIASALGSLLLGLGFLLIAPYFSGRFADILGTPEQGALFTLGVMFTGVSQVVDLATIGLMRGGIQLSRNIVFCTTKLIALPAAAFILHNQLGIGIASAWVGGLVLSLAVVAISLRVCGTSLLVRPDWRLLRSLGGTAMAHNWLNIAMMVPPTVIPVLVTVLVSPSANAAFYIAFMLSGFLYVVPTHLGTVLFAVAAAEPRVMAQKIRFALRLSYLVGLPGVAILILGGHLGPERIRTRLCTDRHRSNVATGFGLPAVGPKTPLHRRLQGKRPDSICGDHPDRVYNRRSRRHSGRRRDKRVDGTIVGASGGIHCRRRGDYPIGAACGHRPGSSSACRLANDNHC